MRRLNAGVILAAMTLAITVACSSTSSARRPGSRQPDLITMDELSGTRYSTALEVVQALRPQWLRGRGRTSVNLSESVKVYVDDSPLGEAEQLRSISARSVGSIRYLDGNSATQRWGMDHGQGAIMVSTRRDTTSRR
ncbi:MAG: hypothetical protein ACREOK_16220 [Gemmatimonadaceae bacterium]